MKSVNLKPLEDRVVVEIVKVEDQTPGGIVLPDTAKEESQWGIVLAIGPGRVLDNGARLESSVAVGDKVLYGKRVGTDVEIDGRDVRILHEKMILAIIVD